MNMIVNKSDLVGYEAVDHTDAKKKALAKIVAAWESKQAKNAARFGGLGFLAVSLAAVIQVLMTLQQQQLLQLLKLHQL